MIETQEKAVLFEKTSKVIPVAIEDEVKTDYLNYAMSVIVARALPDARDGLKPVHRRLLYSMDELGLRPGSATKKCARIVGDAMGKYHPHGDMALYDALARMAQDFSLRYPLVQGQGNFGSIDGDPPAAMRYTEAKLSRIGDEMLQDLNKETVDFIPNFDESLKEPAVLPSAVPNLLVNGASGIAVGMATNMAPHNLREVCAAVNAFIDNPDITVQGLMEHITGPDFPTGGIIFGRRGIRDAYTTGRGKILVRGRYSIETLKGGRELLVFNEIPYGINKTMLLERIGTLIKEKEIDGLSSVNDESDRDGLRIVIELKRGAFLKIVLNQLFSKTMLQNTFGIINLALIKGRPQTLTLHDLIRYFVEHRVEVLTRRTQFELRKDREREHILEGLVIALASIDEVIAIIKKARDINIARENLKASFALSDVQTQAIVEMRLGRLTGLEVEKLQAELKELEAHIAYLEGLLADRAKLMGLIKTETNAIAERFGDARRTEIVDGEIETIDVEELVKKEALMVTISKLGYIKRVPVSAYQHQKRGGKGMLSTKLAEEDFIQQIFVAGSHDYVLFITSIGKAYWMKAYELPEGTRTTKGAHLKGLFTFAENEDITAIVSLQEFSDKTYLFMGTARGIVKKTETKAFANARTRGVHAISLDEGDRLVSALLTDGKGEVVLISKEGKALREDEASVRSMGRAAHGVKGLKLGDADALLGVLKVQESESMLVVTQNGLGKRVKFSEFSQHRRGTGGQYIYRPNEKTGNLVGCVSVAENQEIMCVTSQGKSLRLKANTISVQGRMAHGVRVVNTGDGDMVVGLDSIANEE